MSLVSRRDTGPEKVVFSFLRKSKLRIRKNVKTLPGSPDIVLPEFNTAIFVHGCFWHGHKSCKLAKRPSSNKSYWNKKIDENIERDKRKSRELRKLGWRVFTIWQCQINNKQRSEKKLSHLRKQLIT
jgi:DNA mismatch endonuclease (patch repair protein)